MNEQSNVVKTVRLGRRGLLAMWGAAFVSLLAGRRVDAGNATTPTPTGTTIPNATATAGRVATPEGSPAASPGPVFEASMESLKFIPPEIDIAVGTTVIWTNKDVVAHTVTQRAKPEDQLFSSPLIVPGEHFSFTFDKPGTYNYFCTPHPFMTGTVVVS